MKKSASTPLPNEMPSFVLAWALSKIFYILLVKTKNHYLLLVFLYLVTTIQYRLDKVNPYKDWLISYGSFVCKIKIIPNIGISLISWGIVELAGRKHSSLYHSEIIDRNTAADKPQWK